MPDEAHLLTVFLLDIVYVNAEEAKTPHLMETLLLGDRNEEKEEEWIQLPVCLSCLEKLESRLSGIHYLQYGEDVETRKPSVNCRLCVRKEDALKCEDCG